MKRRCKHEIVTVWTLEEVGQEYDRTSKEWGDKIGDSVIHSIVEIVCAKCTKDLTAELKDEIRL